MARTRRRYSRRTKKYVSISITKIAHYAMQYANLTGANLKDVVAALVASIQNGDDSILDLVMTQVNGAIANITDRPLQTAIKGIALAWVFGELRKVIGSKKLLQVGKFRITA